MLAPMHKSQPGDTILGYYLSSFWSLDLVTLVILNQDSVSSFEECYGVPCNLALLGVQASTQFTK